MIKVKNLVKSYDEHVAVDNLSFTVEKGQILGFLGPNGAGKSTTMNIITGYISPTAGQVLVNDYDILKEPEKAKKCIGYLPEQPPVYNDMKVWEYLDFVAELKGVKKKEERMAAVSETMEKTGITHVKDRLIRHLSKGYKQRVGIAQAIITNPEIIILDEPTVGLDPVQIIEIRDLIRSLAKEHIVILSSHIMQEISAVCDYVMIINKGKMLVSDTTENLVKHLNVKHGLKLTIKGDIEKAEEIITGMPDVEGVEITETQEDKAILNVYTAENADIRENLTFDLAAARIAVLEQSVIAMDLEEIFLEFIKEAEEGRDFTGNTTEEDIEADSEADTTEEEDLEPGETEEDFEPDETEDENLEAEADDSDI